MFDLPSCAGEMAACHIDEAVIRGEKKAEFVAREDTASA
jgi:hypothetical protein